MNNSRICGRCGAEYPATLEHFVPNKQCTGGLTFTCRTCSNAYQRAWKLANHERLMVQRRAVYAERYRPIWQAREERRKRERPLHTRAEIMRSGMVTRSRASGLPFDAETLTVRYIMDWIERTPNCPCCGVAIDYGYKAGKLSTTSPSIDRLRGSDGYVMGNVALICWRCNNLKRDATPDELEGIARWIRSHTADPQSAVLALSNP